MLSSNRGCRSRETVQLEEAFDFSQARVFEEQNLPFMPGEDLVTKKLERHTKNCDDFGDILKIASSGFSKSPT